MQDSKNILTIKIKTLSVLRLKIESDVYNRNCYYKITKITF
jgi:hypothetical protein